MADIQSYENVHVRCSLTIHGRCHSTSCRPWARGVYHAPPPHNSMNQYFSEAPGCPEHEFGC